MFIELDLTKKVEKPIEKEADKKTSTAKIEKLEFEVDEETEKNKQHFNDFLRKYL